MGETKNKFLPVIGAAVLVLIYLTLNLIPGVKEEENTWPAFRGPNGLGISLSESAPTEWNAKENKNILWKLRLPEKSDNSPVIWNDKIFLSSATPEEITILCVNAKDGTIIWKKTRSEMPEASSPLPERVLTDVGHVASTMAVDKNGLFAIFSSGDVVCIDFDGKVKWVQKLGPIANPYGHSSSLITWQGKLFVQIDQEEEKGSLYALDTKSGKIVWQKKRKFMQCWATPIIVSTDKRTELIVNGNPYVMSYNPVTGDVLWKIKYIDEDAEIAPSPAYENGIVFLANEKVYTFGLDIQSSPEGPKFLWKREYNLPDVTSPVAINGLVFVGNVEGVVCCYDGKTGKKYWEQEFDDGFYSSPVYAAGNIYLADKSGNTKIFAAEKEYKLIGSSELGEAVFATPAITGGKIYLRGKKHLYCIGSR